MQRTRITWSRKNALAVMVVALDGFKQVVDFCGQTAGEAVRRETAHRIRESLRAGDLVGRWSEAEFLVLVGAESSSAASAIAERIRERIAGARRRSRRRLASR